MSFFLSSKPPTQPARARLVVVDKTQTKAAVPPRARDWSWAWLALSLVVGTGLGAGWYAARTALREQLSTRVPVPVGADAVRMDSFKNAPWVPERDVRLLLDDVGARLSADPLDGAGLAKAAKRLEQHPAIQKVERIWRDDAGFVQIKALAYHPAAVVDGSGLSVVDTQGHLLTEYLDPAVADQLPIPRIKGVRTPSPSGGKEAIWMDAGLQAGLSLLRHMTLNEIRHLRSLDVGQRDAQKRIVISFSLQGVASEPIDILWGLPTGEEAGIDAAPAKKLAALRALCHDPKVRASQPGARFSVRSGVATALGKPANSAPSANTPRTP